MSDVVNFKGNDPLKKLGVSRMVAAPNGLNVFFNRTPSDEELRIIDDWLDMMINQSGVLQS